ncbi:MULTISPECIES: hypothetical protein [unclassified Brevundimonas]|uniref:hypothetical protein n=1 Tax=unclassified Brevundimonas TaxID=2622653 RepID=UPI0025C50679|nr:MULTISPECIES: hypothetical protein [unclassified Brevundimonas]
MRRARRYWHMMLFAARRAKVAIARAAEVSPLSSKSTLRLAHRIDAAVSRSARPGLDRVADCILALEASCYTEPCILSARNIARERRVAVVLPGYDRLLTSDEARAVAHRLRADNAFAGAFGAALRLDDVADEAERRDPAGGPLAPRPNNTGARVLIIAILIASALLALRAFA